MRIATLLLAALTFAAISTPLIAQGPDDATIVAIFDAANTADIETGQLAADHGSTEQVRNFGRMLVTDHTNVRQQGRDLAARLHVTPTPPSDDAAAEAHRAALAKLRGLSGRAFDRAFLEHEVAFHKAVIEAIKTTLLPAIDNADLQALVEKVAPAFVAHQKAAESLLRNL